MIRADSSCLQVDGLPGCAAMDTPQQARSGQQVGRKVPIVRLEDPCVLNSNVGKTYTRQQRVAEPRPIALIEPAKVVRESVQIAGLEEPNARVIGDVI